MKIYPEIQVLKKVMVLVNMKMYEWKVGSRIGVRASSINHEDDREIMLEYKGNGLLEDDLGRQVSFNTRFYPKLFEGMYISLGLTHNPKVCESYEVSRVEEV